MRDVFSARFEIQDSDPAASGARKIRARPVVFAGADGRICSGDAPRAQAHFIGQLLGFDFSASPYLRELLNDPSKSATALSITSAGSLPAWPKDGARQTL